jgi:hypothetical protein
MMLQFFIPPIILAFPTCGKVQEKKEQAILRRDSAGSEDDISLPSLGDISIGSGESFISEHTCDELSQVELCHLIGPKVSKDDLKHSLPADLVKPKNLEHSMTMNLPVGYYRLRRAFLADDDDFWNNRVLNRTLQYKNISSKGWDRHQNVIGTPSLPGHIKPQDIIGATKKTEYLMPKTALVKANMAYETATITEYNDSCFAIEMFTTNPDVPFGKKFIAHTKIIVYNTGENTCYMECSVQTEFPNGPPMGLAWKIKGAMKSGSMEVFEKIGSSIINCAVSYGWV